MFASGVVLSVGTLGLGVGVAFGGFGLFSVGIATFHRGIQKGLSKELIEVNNAIQDDLAFDFKI